MTCDNNTSSSDFYVTGGNVPLNAACYVERQADKDIYTALKQGQFCYVLNSRQMGKSSLMVRAARQLREDGAAVVVIELTSIGMNLSAEQWYDGLTGKLGSQLGLEDELEDFWDEHPNLGPLNRWMEAIRRVVLPHCPGQVVIFIDEIDVTRSLPFSADEFFAAIRQCYNARTDDPEFERLTFCLIGAATPTDLIRDVRLTPFNIGARIELNDFTEKEAAPLAQGLGREEKQAKDLLKRILYWTNGHPYLTQTLCKALAEDRTVDRPAGVDRICETLFLSARSRESDHNLQFVRDRILRSGEDIAGLLDLYHQVWKRKKIQDDDTHPLIAILRLSGLVKSLENYLWVRNRIYFRAFDKDWIDANMPDAEKRRQKKAFRQGAIRAGLIAAMIIACICGGIVWYLDGYVWENVTYYNTYAKRYGIMEGVGKLTPEQVRRRAVSYKFIRKGRHHPVWKVQAVNSSGQLTSRHELGTYFHIPTETEQFKQPLRECQWKFVLDLEGKIVYEKAYNKYDQLVWGLVYSPPLQEYPTHAHYVGSEGFPQAQTKAAAEFVKFEYSDRGDEIARYYVDRNNHPQPGLHNEFGRLQKFDDRGLAIEIISLDKDNKRMNNEAGIAILKLSRDELGNIVEAITFDAAAKPTISKRGWHKLAAKFDDRGNRSEELFFNTEGKPMFNNDSYHKAIFKYDNRGNQTEFAYFDTEGKPTFHKEGFHKFTAKYDDRGNQTEWVYFDTQGKPTLNSHSYHKSISKYDDRGNQTEWAYFDTQGKPTLNITDYGGTSYHKAIAKYDDRGNKTEKAFFDTEGKPTLGGEGCHKLTAKYNNRGDETEWACFDTQGKPKLDKDGCHKFTVSYDDRRNRIEEACFDTEGKPTISPSGKFHKGTVEYDARGKKNEVAKYDKFGNVIKKEFFDAAGNKVAGEEASFDSEGKPMLNEYGFHKVASKWNYWRNPTEGAYFDIKGRPTLCKDGYHKLTAEYDKRGNLIEAALFDTEDQPTVHKDAHYHRYTVKYDNSNSVGFDESGNHIWGNKTERTDFDKFGKEIAKYRFGAGGKKVSEEILYFDEKGRPAQNEEGYHKEITGYDVRGNWTEASYFDTEGNPTLHKNGFHRVTAKYDERGTRTEGAYFDVNGQPLKTEVLVAEVLPDSQAAKLGIKAGDIFTHYDGKPVLYSFQFDAVRDAEPPDSPPKELKVLRDGKKLVFMISPGKIGVQLQNRAKSAAVSP